MYLPTLLLLRLWSPTLFSLQLAAIFILGINGAAVEISAYNYEEYKGEPCVNTAIHCCVLFPGHPSMHVPFPGHPAYMSHSWDTQYTCPIPAYMSHSQDTPACSVWAQGREDQK